MKNRNFRRRIMAMIMVGIMILSYCPVSLSAEETVTEFSQNSNAQQEEETGHSKESLSGEEGAADSDQVAEENEVSQPKENSSAEESNFDEQPENSEINTDIEYPDVQNEEAEEEHGKEQTGKEESGKDLPGKEKSGKDEDDGFSQTDFLASDGKNYHITVICSADTGIPDDAVLEVKEISDTSRLYDVYVEKTENALGMEEGTADYIRLFDISIVNRKDHSIKYQPAEGTSVDVRIELADSDGGSLSVVHFASGNATGDVVSAVTEGQSVSFEAEGFSIYAITESEKRLKYNFYDGTSLLASEYIREQGGNLQELYDPGVEIDYGQIFSGWAYSPDETDEDAIYSIEQLNAQAADKYEGAESTLTEINVYAIYAEAWYLRYIEEDDQGNETVLKVVRVSKIADDKTATVDYVLTPEQVLNSDGWIDSATGDIYHQNDTIQLDHHVDLYLNKTDRFWLLFNLNTGDSNSGVDYIPPQLLIGNDAKTVKPVDPVRKGYVFSGWNTKADGTGEAFVFGTAITANTVIYAIWEPAETEYYVVFWQQKTADEINLPDAEKTYAYVSAEKRTALTGSTVSLNQGDKSKGDNGENDPGEYGFYFTYNESNSDTEAVVSADGDTILNVYYDRKTITINFTTPTDPAPYGKYAYMAGEFYPLYYKLDNEDRVNVGDNDDHDEVEYRMPNGRYYSLSSTFSLRYRSDSVITQTLQGLYGSLLSVKDWPEPGAGYIWHGDLKHNRYYSGRATQFEVVALFNDTGRETEWNLYAMTAVYSEQVYTYLMDITGNYPSSKDDYYEVGPVNGDSLSINPEKYHGFVAARWEWGTDEGELNGESEQKILRGGEEDSDVYVYYRRLQYKLHFISEGENVTERTEKVIDDIYYEAPLDGFTEGGTDYYEPENGKDGYYFAGWYADQNCLVPFDFSQTMPDHDLTLYAKWEPARIRVVLVPTPGNAENEKVFFANEQQLSFLLNYKETVNDQNIQPGIAKRQGYKLVGWYTSPTFERSAEWNFETNVDKNVPAVNMDYQSSEDWDNYGDNDGKHENVRGILKLYAKWVLDVDENSVYVEYDVDETFVTYDADGNLQTVIPIDDTKYVLTDAGITFQVGRAPVKYTNGFDFDKWVLLNSDGSESEKTFYPGNMALQIPSAFIQEETIRDDAGNSAVIKRIRLKAKFKNQSEKVTSVTYNGNGGVTNDTAAMDSVTDSYPVNMDFALKDADSFRREGYTLIGWAFRRKDGSRITAEDFRKAEADLSAAELVQAGIYRPGQQVAADNLEISDENKWDNLENTLYAVWEINTYTVTLKKIARGEAADALDYAFVATAADGYELSPENANFTLSNEGQKIFAKVPYGTELTFTEESSRLYRIVNVQAKQTTEPDKTALSEADYIDLGGANGKTYVIKGDTVVTYTNETIDPHYSLKKETTSTAKSGDGKYVLGETITYKITVTNTGNVTLKNIVVTDELTGDTFDPIESLAPGRSVELTPTPYVVTEADVKAGKVVNIATAKADDPRNPDPVDPNAPVNSEDSENPDGPKDSQYPSLEPEQPGMTEDLTKEVKEDPQKDNTETQQDGNNTNKEKPETSETNKNGGSVRTGDDTPIGLCVMLLFFATVAATGGAYAVRKRRKVR